jgi:hypothetical protein
MLEDSLPSGVAPGSAEYYCRGLYGVGSRKGDADRKVRIIRYRHGEYDWISHLIRHIHSHTAGVHDRQLLGIVRNASEDSEITCRSTTGGKNYLIHHDRLATHFDCRYDHSHTAAADQCQNSVKVGLEDTASVWEAVGTESPRCRITCR